MNDKSLYKEDSIESLSPLAFTRLQPGVYCGDTTYSTQLLVEIVSNAVDEYRFGHGSRIEVNIQDNVITVRDYGQGFLVNSMRDDGKTILEAAFSVLNTSGKYREDGTYEGTSLGSFGIGSKITNYLSHWLIVTTYRDNKYEKVYFKEGVFDWREIGDTNQPSGTEVSWLPSEEFFTHTEVELDKVKSLFDTITCLCPGLEIILSLGGENSARFYSENGLADLADKAVGDKEIIGSRFSMNFVDGKNKLDLILTYTSNYSSTIVPYVNTGLTERGPHITQIKTIITREFNKFFKEKKWLKEKDDNLSGDDIQEGMYIVFNITSPNVQYDSQTKGKVTQIDTSVFSSALAQELQTWLSINEKEIKSIADKAINARKAREAARKARDAVRETKGKKDTGLKAKMSLSSKFTDCASRNPKERNLLLVEGKSAAGSAIEARNPKIDCIYQLRGKILSVLKSTREKVLANQELFDITKVIGAGFAEDFDINKMQFDKIVITSDQDADGFNIELLLITFFFTYMRPLVTAGKLYRAVTPLYIIREKGKEHYCYTESEFSDWKVNHSGKYEVLRAKGLGELQPKDLQKVCFKDQRFKRITVSDAEKAEELLNVLMGPSSELRKQYIYDNATELGFHFD